MSQNDESSTKIEFGTGDSSYRAAGELPGLIKLVDAFYYYMDTLPEAKTIRDMHREDLSEVKKKLAYFLSGWLGGPRLFSEHYGQINIPGVHRHFTVKEAERDAWISCMQSAVADQPYDAAFKTYLIEQLRVPAERIRVVCDDT